jgi:hypothetical protein
MSAELNLYDTEFPCGGEVEVESDVDLEFGVELGRRTPLPALYVGLIWLEGWWRTAIYDPNHDMAILPSYSGVGL